MKEKVKITKENYKEMVLKRSIICCWLLLIICFIIKICGGNYFEIMCSSEKFIKFCNFIDKYYINIAFQLIYYSFSSFFIIKYVNYNISRKRWVIISSVLLPYWIIKVLIFLKIININVIIYDVLDFLILYACCIISYDKSVKLDIKFILKPIFEIIMLYIFSLISSVVKNIGIGNTLNNSFLDVTIFMIDYYIMIILNYLYQKRRYCRWEVMVGFTG